MNDTRLDILIGRTVDAVETPAEWTELCTAADAHPGAWRELAVQQRQARLLADELDHASAAAELVDLPHASSAPVAGRIVPGGSSVVGAAMDAGTSSRAMPSRWLGWAVAACVAGAWALSGLPGNGVSGSGAASRSMQTAGLSFDTPDDALQAYLDQGRADGIVVGEMPSRVLIDSRPVPNGDGFEVIFVRQIVERRSVPALFQLNQADELGRPVPVRVVGTRGQAM